MTRSYLPHADSCEPWTYPFQEASKPSKCIGGNVFTFAQISSPSSRQRTLAAHSFLDTVSGVDEAPLAASVSLPSYRREDTGLHGLSLFLHEQLEARKGVRAAYPRLYTSWKQERPIFGSTDPGPTEKEELDALDADDEESLEVDNPPEPDPDPDFLAQIDEPDQPYYQHLTPHNGAIPHEKDPYSKFKAAQLDVHGMRMPDLKSPTDPEHKPLGPKIEDDGMGPYGKRNKMEFGMDVPETPLVDGPIQWAKEDTAETIKIESNFNVQRN